MLKPHKQIYEYMLSSLKLIPDECLFIDDTAANVKGAGELGINTIQFTSPEQLEKELIELGLY